MTSIFTARPGNSLFGVTDVLATAGMTAWYALPDYIHSRTTRGVVKAGLLTIGTAYGFFVLGRGVAEDLDVPSTDEPSADAEDSGRDDATGTKVLTRPVVLGGAAVAVLSVAGVMTAITVGMERVVFRYGERLSQRSVRFPHTRIGIVAGVSTATLILLDNAVRKGREPAAA